MPDAVEVGRSYGILASLVSVSVFAHMCHLGGHCNLKSFFFNVTFWASFKQKDFWEQNVERKK